MNEQPAPTLATSLAFANGERCNSTMPAESDIVTIKTAKNMDLKDLDAEILKVTPPPLKGRHTIFT